MAKFTKRLEGEKAALDDAARHLAELESKRNAALLADDDRTAGKLLGEIEQQRRLIRGHHDKIGLLQAEAEREEVERVARERAGLISRIEKKISERNAAAAELTVGLEQAARALGKMVELGSAIAAAWPWPAGYLPPHAADHHFNQFRNRG
jgi:hypothetical protein